jgi:CYTH domain-containing protein
VTAIPKYARLENERRFWVAEPPDLSAARVRLIDDLYLEDSQLRLRAITSFDGAAPEFKLCKKYGSDDPASGAIVNIYLSAAEHAMLSTLPGHALRKRRHAVPHNGSGFSVDVFEGPLTGLVLCEAEAESTEAIRALAFPPWATREVTADSFFTGGNLARLTTAKLRQRLRTMREKLLSPRGRAAEG